MNNIFRDKDDFTSNVCSLLFWIIVFILGDFAKLNTMEFSKKQ